MCTHMCVCSVQDVIPRVAYIFTSCSFLHRGQCKAVIWRNLKENSVQSELTCVLMPSEWFHPWQIEGGEPFNSSVRNLHVTLEEAHHVQVSVLAGVPQRTEVEMCFSLFKIILCGWAVSRLRPELFDCAYAIVCIGQKDVHGLLDSARSGLACWTV